jgi:hypothetical protein
VAVAAATQLLGSNASRADDLYLDSDGIGTVSTGSAIWDTTLNRWAPTASSVAPFGTWVDNSNAIFTGPGGTITLGGGALTAGGINVQSGKYFIESSGGTLSWGNTATLNVATGADLQVFSSIGGSSGLTKIDQRRHGLLRGSQREPDQHERPYGCCGGNI